ncbi:MAG: DEAD/DEAH box helicase [Flavobacteriaceae bacterium]|nr:DEAD/DEAH box helicase [Flavobacteriaceae bacterium]
MQKLVSKTIRSIKENTWLTDTEILEAKNIFERNEHVILSQGQEIITVFVEDKNQSYKVSIIVDNGDKRLFNEIDGKEKDWSVYGLVALYVIEDNSDLKELPEGKKYTREGMKMRVLEERQDRANKAEYKIKLANNLYGEHTLINEKGKSYKITLRDFDNKTGYINNFDLKTNKLGTTKHILFLYNYLEENPSKVRRLKKNYPFIEIYLDPLNEYKISWFFPENLEAEEQALIDFYFDDSTFIEDFQIASFFTFIHKAIDFQRIKIRDEVLEKIEHFFNDKELAQIKEQTSIDFSSIKADLYPYQKEGVEFSLFKKGVIIADEMGLGKTLQALATAILKKTVFNFKKTLVITPASVKHQWKSEVLKFSDEKAIVIEGFPDERVNLYLNDESYFHIINYETVLRDLSVINKANYDFIILDEAQKIKNYETKTANAVKAIRRKHALVITGTPLENKILDLYSIVQFIDPYFLAPQWEFSYQHCIFDSQKKNKIQGYYNLQNLKKRLNSILIRREKQEVFKQLPNVIEKNVYVSLSDEQANLHAGFSRGIASILRKKFKTIYDWQKLMHLLTNMRMVCDSSFLIDKESHHSPKLVELKHILLEKLDVKSNNRKIIIFSEWVTMLNLIADELKKEGIIFTMLTGKVPVKKRGALIKEFEENPECTIFLSSESGGTGLNLQVADTVINFELPWNPAKKNQRIGRIDRIGQQKQILNVFNLVSYDSIEMKIATGLLLKQSLFDGILSPKNKIDEVDFTEKGKSQFIQQLEDVILDNDIESPEVIYEDNDLAEIAEEQNELIETLQSQITETEKATTNTVEKTVVKTQTTSTDTTTNYQEMEEVMNKGMEFLTGVFKMSTGKELSTDGKPKVAINKETGEVSITFKIGS